MKAGARKAAYTALTFTLLLLFCASHAHAGTIKIDGNSNEPEWAVAKAETIVSSKAVSNCGITEAIVKTISDENNYTYYLLVMLSYEDPSGENGEEGSKVGISIETPGSGVCKLTADGLETPDGSDEYFDLQGAMSIIDQENNMCVCEMKIGIKHGSDSVVTLRFYDADGIPSNVYKDFSLEPRTQPTTTIKETTEKTTKEKTAKEKTTKPTTTKATTQPTTKPTTARSFTTAPHTTSKAEKTTKEKTTKEKTTKEKTTKEKTTRAKTSRPVTERAVTKSETVLSAEVAEPVTEQSSGTEPSLTEQTTQTQSAQAQTRETGAQLKLKRTISYAGIALLLVLAFGAAAVGVSRNKANNDNKNADQGGRS